MNANYEYWISLTLIIIGSFSMGFVFGSRMIVRSVKRTVKERHHV